MNWKGQFCEAFLDDDHAFSMGRLIAFIGVCLAVELIQAGLFLVFYSMFKPDNIASAAVGTGMGIIGVGAGFFTGGALLKFGTKGQEGTTISPGVESSGPSERQ
jgi:hypothetical protein